MKKIVFTLITLFISLNLLAINKQKSIKTIDPIVISINLPKDQVWQRVMDLFVANSVPIKLMDKSSGLIQSDKIGLGSHYALKNADDSLAWALCEAVNNPEDDGFYLFPQVINTELQVYIRETADGKVLLSLNLMNLTAASHDLNTGNDRDFPIQSTKRLENIIGNYLKTFEKMPTLAFDPPFATFGEAPSQTQRREDIKLGRIKKYQELVNSEAYKLTKEEEEREHVRNNLRLIFGLIFTAVIVVLRVSTK